MAKSETTKVNQYSATVKNQIAKKNTANVFKMGKLAVILANARVVKIAYSKYFLINKFKNNHF